MTCTTRARTGRKHRKLCVRCGYDGVLMQADPACSEYACPRCGTDLYARPPKSYAEMEGLDTMEGPGGATFDRLTRLMILSIEPALLSRRARTRRGRGLTLMMLAAVIALVGVAFGATAVAALH